LRDTTGLLEMEFLAQNFLQERSAGRREGVSA
jgi:hypothetical protein